MKRKNFFKKLPLFHAKSINRNTRGAAIAEYGILAGIVIVTSVGTVFSVGEKIEGAFISFKDTLSNPELSQGSGDATPPPVDDPYAMPSPYHPMENCTVYTKGDDFVAANNSVECYALLTGVDTFTADSHATGVSVTTDATDDSLNPDARDNITLSPKDDYFVGYGRPDMDAGDGNDAIDLTMERIQGDHAIYLGSGNDHAVFRALDFENSDGGKTSIYTGGGDDTLDLQCNNRQKPYYALHVGDKADLRSNCQVEAFFDGWPMSAHLDATISNTDSARVHMWSPGTFTGTLNIDKASLYVDIHYEMSGYLKIRQNETVDPGFLTLYLKEAAGSMANFGLDVDGTYGLVDLAVPPSLSKSVDLTFDITRNSKLTYQLGDTSASEGWPEIEMKGQDVSLRLDSWYNATRDGLIVELVKSDGSIYATYDMAAENWEADVDFVFPRDLDITKIRVKEGADMQEIKFNTPQAKLQVDKISIYFDRP